MKLLNVNGTIKSLIQKYNKQPKMKIKLAQREKSELSGFYS